MTNSFNISNNWFCIRISNSRYIYIFIFFLHISFDDNKKIIDFGKWHLQILIDVAFGSIFISILKINSFTSPLFFGLTCSSFHFETEINAEEKIIKSYLRSCYLRFYRVFFSLVVFFLCLLWICSFFKMCWLRSRQCDRINNTFCFSLAREPFWEKCGAKRNVHSGKMGKIPPCLIMISN